MITEMDSAWMRYAIKEAENARFWATPNPPVGCVLVRDAREIARGFTQPAGGDHAEIRALLAVETALGSTAYVTLEPCAHHGYTGPCVEALIASGVSRVVVALLDPNPEVSGRGIERLKQAGVQVDVGVEADAARDRLRGFLLRMERGYGRIRLKLATSMDGRTATSVGESQWITGGLARSDVQRLRAESCAILTASGTVINDNCRLTLREQDWPLDKVSWERARKKPPTRVVVCGQRKLPISSAILNSEAPTIVYCSSMVEAKSQSAEWVVSDENEGTGSLALKPIFTDLGRRGFNEILVEAGPTFAGALLAGNWVDEVVLYQAPRFLGSNARPLARLSIDYLHESLDFLISDVSQLGEDIRIRMQRR